MLQVDLSKINVLAELDHLDINYEYTGDQYEIKTNCPFHKDENPSCFINIEKRKFICHTAGCEKQGDILTLLAAKLKISRNAVIIEIAKRYSIDAEDQQIIDFSTVERFHSELPKAIPLLAELYKRGITDEDIKKYRLGFDPATKRIIIPIRNREGLFVLLRKYLPGAPGPDKMRNSKGHGKSRLFPIEQLEYPAIMFCGGEIKAIPAARQLNPYNIGAICSTAGEGNWDNKHTDYFTNKIIYICMDIDEAGIKAALIRARILSKVAKEVYIVTLPLDISKYPKGDINDYIMLHSNESNIMHTLIQNPDKDNPSCKLYTPVFQKLELTDDEPIYYDLAESINAKLVGTRIKTTGIVVSLDTAPYVIPKQVFASCDRSQKFCSICGIFKNKEDHLYTINSESINILDLVNSKKSSQRESLIDFLSIPKKCPVVEFHPHTYYNCEDSRVAPQLEITNRAADRLMQPAVVISKEDKLDLNEAYEFVGRNWPSPQTQQSTLVLSDYIQTTDTLSLYKLTEEYVERLKIFQPTNPDGATEWSVEYISSKLDEIYSDLSANVTRIFQRDKLHLAVDLAYHSPLFINFDGRDVKGWVEILIIGDTAQGKSDVARYLQDHYKLGEKIESKNATVAGLLGGLQKSGEKWFVTWGVIPTHDKRLVIMEELKGASTDVISKLTDMRSSGVAEIPKIEKRRAHARTRLLAISNSRSGRALSSYSFGVETVKELIGALEDVRRFDFALLLSQNEIDNKILNQLQVNRPIVEHKFTADLCRNLILWAWTSECEFEEGAESLCLDVASKISGEFTDAIPLVDKGSMRFKVARLAAALAARTFSFIRTNVSMKENVNNESVKNVKEFENDSDGSKSEYKILIRSCHVEYIYNLIMEIYSNNVFGYRDYTTNMIEQETISENGLNEIKHELKLLSNGKEFCKKLLYVNSIDQVDIQDFASCDREVANNLISLLVRKNALHRIKGRYYKSTQFIEFLKAAIGGSNCELVLDLPQHILDRMAVEKAEKMKEKF